MGKMSLWFSAAVALVALAGCGNAEKAKVSALNTEKPTRSAFLVEATRPERRDVSEYLTETGTITAENQVEVLAKGTGHCMTLHVEEGDQVEKDQVLAELDKAEAEAQVRQSRVNVAQHKVSYERADAGMRQGIISRAERDNAQFAYEQAKATLDMQEVQLTYLTIRAPIAGVVTKRALQEGMLVSSGTPVFRIVDPASFILPIHVTERSLPRLRIGQEARVTIDSSGDREFTARVRRINPGIDAQTGTIKVVLDFEEKDYPYLRESAFARYSLVMDTHEDALVVPKDAIVEESARRYVMVLREAPEPPAATDTTVTVEHTGWVAARMEVETGLEDSNYTEILSGIDPETLVITLGQQSVKDGDPVRVGSTNEMLESRADLKAGEALEKAREKKERDTAAGDSEKAES